MHSKIKLKKTLAFAHEQNNKMNTWFNNKQSEDDIYTKIISAYVSIVIEHHKSIIELTNVRQISALCLVRPLYEAYLRVTWISLFIDSPKVDKVIKKLIELKDDNSFPSLKVMAEEIDTELSILNRETKRVLSKDLENNIYLFHSYTHGGAFMVSLLINKKDLFTHEDMIDIIKSTTLQLLDTLSAYALTLKDIELAKKVYKESEKLTAIDF